MGAITLVAEAPGNINQHELSRRSPFWHQDPIPHNSLQAPVQECLRPNNEQDRNTAPPIRSIYILIKLTKIKYKEKILKATREKQQITYKGIPIRLSPDFSAETLQARRKWHDIFKLMKGKNLQPAILYPARLSFRFNGEIKSFTDKQKLREFITNRPALQQMLKELL